MPCALVLRERASRASPDDNPEIDPTNVKLYLPSEIGAGEVCSNKLRDYEWRLRIAEAHDALNEIRHHLRLRSHMYKFKDRFQRGQRANTQSRATIARVQDHVEAAADKYIAARTALERLAPILGKNGWEGQLRPLNRSTDLQGLTADGYQQSNAKRKLPGRGTTEAGHRQSESRRKLSWIWLTTEVELDSSGKAGDKGLHEGEFHWLLV
jgi:hypothetical protein